jgi:hypothetical protein
VPTHSGRDVARSSRRHRSRPRLGEPLTLLCIPTCPSGLSLTLPCVCAGCIDGVLAALPSPECQPTMVKGADSVASVLGGAKGGASSWFRSRRSQSSFADDQGTSFLRSQEGWSSLHAHFLRKQHSSATPQHKQKHLLRRPKSECAQKLFSSFKTAEGRLASLSLRRVGKNQLSAHGLVVAPQGRPWRRTKTSVACDARTRKERVHTRRRSSVESDAATRRNRGVESFPSPFEPRKRSLLSNRQCL